MSLMNSLLWQVTMSWVWVKWSLSKIVSRMPLRWSWSMALIASSKTISGHWMLWILARRIARPRHRICAIRDAGPTDHAEMIVLERLLYRARAEAAYMCFPGIALICSDARLKKTSVFRALKGLEEAGFIRRVPRPNHASRYYILVNRIGERLEAHLLAKAKAEREEACDPAVRGGCSADEGDSDDAPDRDNADVLDADFGDADAYTSNFLKSQKVAPLTPRAVAPVTHFPEHDGSGTSMTQLLWYVRENLPDHSTFSDPGLDPAHFRRCLADCCILAGSIRSCTLVFLSAIEKEPKVRANLQAASNLGGYLRKCLPGWVEKYGPSLHAK